MQPIILGNPRKFDLATVDSGDWRAATPVTLLQDMQPSRVARTTNLTNTFFVVDFTPAGGAVAVNALWLLAANLSAAATVRVRGATSEANLTAAPGFDSTAVSAWPGTGRAIDEGMESWPAFKKLANSTAYVWWRVDISDATNPAGYLEFGRAILAAGLQLAISFTFDWSWSYQPADPVNRTPFGHTLPQARLRPRLFNLPFEALSEAEMWNGLGALQRLRGTGQDIAVCLDADATTYLHQYICHGLIGDPISFGQPAGAFDTYQGRVNLVELL